MQFRTESQAGVRKTAQPARLTSRQGKKVPPDQALREVTESIYKKDWLRVANKLGFFTQDVEEIQRAYPNNPQQQVDIDPWFNPIYFCEQILLDVMIFSLPDI